MTRQLVLVHGRGQEDRDPGALKRAWLDALAHGLGDLTLPVGEDAVRFPYYGDTLMDMVGGVSPDEAARVVVRGEPPEDEKRMIGEVLDEVRRREGVTDEQVSAAAELPVAERGPQNWPWVLALLRAIDTHVPNASARSIALATRDVHHYLGNAAVREEIDEGLREAFEEGTETVVVAHSLGTVVAYRLLRREGHLRGWRVPRFITLGSPLAVTAIKKRLAADDTLRVPECVQRWENYLDPHDLVSLYPLTTGRFPLPDDGPRIVEVADVDNRTPNQHGIEGYLGDTRVAASIHEALGGG